MDSRTSARQIRSKIKELLRDLGLTNCVNTKIGYPGDSKVLSGGEKKRLAFATEVCLLKSDPISGLGFYFTKFLRL